jgi:hypothetical protein
MKFINNVLTLKSLRKAILDHQDDLLAVKMEFSTGELNKIQKFSSQIGQFIRRRFLVIVVMQQIIVKFLNVHCKL